MTMFDFLRVEAKLPDGHVKPGHSFQTWSLVGSVEHFTITAQGRLVHHCRPCQRVAEIVSGQATSASLLEEDIDMEFHGDIEFFGQTEDHKPAYYSARFTHGLLEWIHRLEVRADLPASVMASH